jgi:type I restriction enzyme S subunit
MELKKGYKQTEIGVIPEEWKLMTIDQIFEFHSTSNYSKDQMLTNGEIGCLHYGLIHSIPNNIYNIQNGVKYFVTQQQAKYEFIKEGDVVMVDASEDLSGVNKSIEVSGIQDNLYISGLHTYLLRDRGFFEKYFRGPILNSYFAKAQFYRLAVGMKVFGVSKQQLRTVLLPIPTKSEQIAIANALSDADAYITSLEKLIDKKCQIKQGAMQELMNPKDGWEIKKLGEFNFDISDGNYSSKYPNSSEFKTIGIPFIRANNIRKMSISDNDMRFISPELHSELKKGHLKKNDILLTTRGEIGQLALVPDSHIDSNINAQIVRINTEEKIDTKFLAYFFTKNETQNEFMNAQTGSALKQLPINKLKEIQIIYPSLSTQKNISQILYDIDKDLFQLESNLEKAKSMKQGMMQNLLTGKIRLL